MQGDIPQDRGLSLRIVYDDLPDLIEVEVRVVSDEWSGVAQAYTDPASLAEDARGLLAWSRHTVGESHLEAGADTGIGWRVFVGMRSIAPVTSSVTLNSPRERTAVGPSRGGWPWSSRSRRMR